MSGRFSTGSAWHQGCAESETIDPHGRRHVKAVVVGGGSWGSAFARLLADRDHEVTLACRDSEQAEAIAETGRNPRYLPNVDLRDVAATSDIPERRRALRARGSEPRLRSRRGHAPARRGRALADEGPRPRDRRAPVDARSRPPGRRPLGPEHGRGDRRGAAERGRDRERGRGARRGAPARDQLDGLPRLRQSRPRRRRALRGREERDRARCRRRRRRRPRRQRQGGADHARAGRDVPPRRGRPAPGRRPSPASPGWAT